MTRAMTIPAFLLGAAVLGAVPARADPIFVTTASITTSGTFNCRSTVPCSGEGTNTLTIGSGGSTATLTFTGLSTSFDVTNHLTPVTLGTFGLTAPDGFLFPSHPANPDVLPIVRFNITLLQNEPGPSGGTKQWQFGPGGQTVLPLIQGFGFFVRPAGPNPFNYGSIVYSVRPFPFTLRPNQEFALTAQVGATPEPASLLLLGTGLAGAVAARRRRATGE